ncbi:hypothetical protein NPA07_03295 [Mycoplasmopsis caviae]|uniref:Uncharacterized protein n=1 Tax=Mycoplasmopsis caviae TaxID=55603 RepID=A0A3P8MEU6_9BACT|nr:hypothetical protein [Mycoplasmopsis caviae]UUD34822.1 hypothetical protein NPA07_03295 [Mycoplasmopsis caviae]VDR42326.1 Uncharacterised protein [Mycoplasmopsis caviae]
MKELNTQLLKFKENSLIFNEKQLKEIQLGLEKGVDVSIYAKPEFDWEQMNQITIGLMQDLDVSKYADVKYSGAQMCQIRLGLLSGLDVSKYADPKLSSKEMKEINRKLFWLSIKDKKYRTLFRRCIRQKLSPKKKGNYEMIK